MELSNYWVFKTRSGLFVNRTARELLFEVNQTTQTNLKQLAKNDCLHFRDRETLSLMLGPCSPKRVESQWTSIGKPETLKENKVYVIIKGLAGSTREMGRHGATVR